MAYRSGYAKSSNYWCLIYNKSAQIEYLLDLPDRFSIGVQSQFESIDISLMSFGATNKIAQFNGGNMLSQELTKLMWRGTSPIEFTLPLTFDAYSNAFYDVHSIVAHLQMLCLPISSGEFGVKTRKKVLRPPNPTRWSDDNKTTIRLGRQFLFDSVTMLSANLTSESRLDSQGMPIAAQIDLTFSTDFVYGRSDYAIAAGISAAGAMEKNSSMSSADKGIIDQFYQASGVGGNEETTKPGSPTVNPNRPPVGRGGR